MSHYDKDFALEVGDRLRRVRLAEGLTQKQLAKRAGLHPSTISSTETGRVAVMAATFLAAIKALGADIEKVLAGIEWIEPTTAGAGGIWRFARAGHGSAIA